MASNVNTFAEQMVMSLDENDRPQMCRLISSFQEEKRTLMVELKSKAIFRLI